MGIGREMDGEVAVVDVDVDGGVIWMKVTSGGSGRES